MAERVFIALGQKPRFLMLPSNFLQTGFRAIFQRMNEDLVFDVAEGLKILDYQPRPFKLEFPDMLPQGGYFRPHAIQRAVDGSKDTNM
jgi:hypothetical protein